MKSPLPAVFSWLTFAALADWLILRTLTRAIIFMPKPPILLQVYALLGYTGQLAMALTGLLAAAALCWIAWGCLHRHRNLILALTCIGLIGVNLAALFIPAVGWLAISFHLLIIIALIALNWQAWKQPLAGELKIAITCISLSLLVSRLYQGLDPIYLILRLPGPPEISGMLFNSGEVLLLVSVFALWWAFGRQSPRWIWLVAAVPAVVFTIPRLLAPGITGIMTIWSTGLTMFLPWPLYVAALWLAGVTVINALRVGEPAGFAVLLLAAGGMAPQLSTQAFLGIAALWLLLNPDGYLIARRNSKPGHLPNTPAQIPQMERI